MTHLILGCGFLGSSLCDGLLSITSDTIYVVSRSRPASLSSDQIKHIAADAFTVSTFSYLLASVHTLYYFLPSGFPASDTVNPLSIISSFSELILACKRFNVSRFIFASSVAVYGESKTRVHFTESSGLHPVSLHAEIKSVQERILLSHSTPSFYPLICRISNPYGYNQTRNAMQGIVGIIIRKLSSSQQIVLRANGHCTRDFIYIDDLITMILEVSRNPPPEINILNLCQGFSTDILSVYNLIASYYRTTNHPLFSELAPHEVHDSFVSNSLLASLYPHLTSNLTPIEIGISKLLSYQ